MLVRIGKADVVAVKLPVSPVAYQDKEGSQFPDRLIRDAAQGEESRHLVLHYRFDLVPRLVKDGVQLDGLHVFKVFPVFRLGHIGKARHDLGDLLPIVLARYQKRIEVFPD